MDSADDRTVTADDVRAAVAAAVEVLDRVPAGAWDEPAHGLTWTRWETVEHVADDLFAYAGQVSGALPSPEDYVPFAWSRQREGGPAGSVWARRAEGPAGLARTLDACGGMLAAVVATVGPDVRGYHPDGVSDPEGFAAMGVVETLAHLHDVTEGLDLSWVPDDALCRRVLDRLFPQAPTDQPAWPTMLWATGRGALPGRERQTDWRWDGRPAAER